MIRNKFFSVAVVLVCVVAFAAAPTAAWADGPGSARSGSDEASFAWTWLSSAWSWLADTFEGFGSEGATLDRAIDASGVLGSDPLAPDGGSGESGEGGEAGPGIDPDGKP